MGLWMLWLACTGADLVETETETETEDPRADPAGWPETIDVGEREVSVFAPSTYEGELLPVWVSLHGYSGNSAFQDLYWGTSEFVEEGRYVLAVPDGTTDQRGLQFWNGTDLCCDLYGTGVDDEGFLLELLDAIEVDFPVDPDRIYVSGHSNGGFMSTRMACNAADRVAAIASLAGSGWSSAEMCDPSEPVSVLQVHGTADETIPYEDGWTPGALTMMSRWVERNGCSGEEEGGTMDLSSTVDGAETVITNYTGCEDGVEQALWTMEGAGHTTAFGDAWTEELWGWLSRQSR